VVRKIFALKRDEVTKRADNYIMRYLIFHSCQILLELLNAAVTHRRNDKRMKSLVPSSERKKLL
jgi:hypothetical protein